ncbi:hypothetical protein M088_3510 [Bacteroides ovatus str. 3725 D1 iv]|nr:hypothetical protein M088_3510 [Bacteroides ovatus str. 3725 D1 iv]
MFFNKLCSFSHNYFLQCTLPCYCEAYNMKLGKIHYFYAGNVSII